MILDNLSDKSFFSFFEEISSIPHGSGNEKAISDYLYKFAKDKGLEVIQDESLNIIIKKPGQGKNANSPTVILQGHMDMVCEKNDGTDHDFLKDPLKLKVEGDYIMAEGTTLGADDGVAVAYVLSILADKTISHPPLEVLITTEEETGMGGAIGVDGKNLTGKKLINIDSDIEGTFLSSCAGGSKPVLKFPLKKIPNEDKIAFDLSVTGLMGGHSGIEIHKERGNSIKILGRVLNEIQERFQMYIGKIDGGAKDNAIPREAFCTIYFDIKDLDGIKKVVSEYSTYIKTELKTKDPNLEILFTQCEKIEPEFFSQYDSGRIISAIMLIPNGVQFMSADIEGLVETSNNLGVITTNGLNVTIKCAVRSSVKSRRGLLEMEIKKVCDILGGDFMLKGSYPAWQYEENSPLRQIFMKTYSSLSGKEGKVDAVHAGLECGIFAEKLDGVDMISFGPDVFMIHTPEERASISSMIRCYDLLITVLENL